MSKTPERRFVKSTQARFAAEWRFWATVLAALVILSAVTSAFVLWRLDQARERLDATKAAHMRPTPFEPGRH